MLWELKIRTAMWPLWLYSWNYIIEMKLKIICYNWHFLFPYDTCQSCKVTYDSNNALHFEIGEKYYAL